MCIRDSLDIEHPKINEVVKPYSGSYLKIIGMKDGFMVKGKSWTLIVKCKTLSDLFSIGEETYAWVGGKIGGLYIGFRKTYVQKLEEKAIKMFNIAPR